MPQRNAIFVAVAGVVLLLVLLPIAFSSPLKSSGTASYYADYYEGRITASGEVFRNGQFTAASWQWYGRRVRVTNLANGASIVVRCNDRGPAKRLVREGRIIDLSQSAFRALSPRGLRPGLLEVSVTPLP